MIRRRGANRVAMATALALAVALALVLSGCSGRTTPSDQTAPTTPDTRPEPSGCQLAKATSSETTTAGAPIEVKVWEPYHGQMGTTLEQVVTRYNASQHRVKVVLDASAASTAEEETRLDQAATGDRPAVVVLDAARTQALADSKAITPAALCRKGEENDETSPLPVVRAAYTVDKTDLAAATTLDTPVLFYNRIHFTRAGLDPNQPPRTLAEVAKVAAKLQQAGISAKPLTMPLGAELVEGWLTGAGVNIVDHENGRAQLASASAFDNPRTLDIYTWLRALDAAGLVNGLPPSSVPAAGLAELLTQQSSMAFAPATAIGALQTFAGGRGDTAALGLAPGTSLVTTAAGDVDVAPLPGLDGPGHGQVTGSAWYLTSAVTPDQRAGAWEFLQYLGNIDNQVQINLEASVPPSNTKAIDDPALQAVWSKPGRGHWLDTAYTQITNFDQQAPGPLIGPSTEVRDAIEASLVAVTTGGHPPAEAIATADKAIDDAIRAYAAAHPQG